MSAQNIRVLVVDDQPYARRGLSLFLEECNDLELAGEAENGKEAIKLVEQLQPDVVLMDLIMHVMDGVTATRIIHQIFPHIQIIVLTNLVDTDVLQKSLEAGARRCISKDVTRDELVEIIRAIAG
jgi:DNA-binding NarL/FixJ family response regulator